MGKKSRDKGARGERELAALLGGKRVPLSGAADGFFNDVELSNGMRVEVKRRKDGFKQLYDWVFDERERPDMVAIRTDRRPWVIAMPIETLIKLMGGEGDGKS